MKLAGFDVETSGTLQEYALQPHRVLTGQAWLTSFAFSVQTQEKMLSGGQLAPTVEHIRKFLALAYAKKWRVVGWNTPFDVAWLIAMGLREEVFTVRWLDAMLMWKHLTARPDFATADGKRQAFGLKEAVRQFILDAAGYEKDVDFHAEDDASRSALLHYNKLDTVYTLQLAEQFLAQMPAGMRRNVLIEAAAIPHIAETLVEGLPVDVLNTVRLHRKLKTVRRYNFSKLALEQGVTEKVLASPKQLSTLLFETWGLTSVKKNPGTKTNPEGSESTDKDALELLAEADPRAKLVRDYREAGNLDTKFCAGTLASARYNGTHRGQRVVRPAARMFGTYTGRMTYSSKQGKGKAERPVGVPLHQWKRQAEFRRIVTVPEGYDLCEFDFAGQEFRWMAVESGDATMLQLCGPGEDAHAYMGGRISRIEYAEMRRALHTDPPDPVIKAKRQLGKVANLALQYRTSAKTLRIRARTDYSIRMTDIEAKAIHATYQLTYRGVPEYWQRQILTAKHQGYVATLAGRRVQLGVGTEWPRNLAWSYESTAINFPIQGVGADQKYLAICVISDYLPRVGARFAFELHDGLFFFVPKAHTQRAVREMRQILSNLPYEKAWGCRLPIQFPVDAKVGSSWGDLKEVHD